MRLHVVEILSRGHLNGVALYCHSGWVAFLLDRGILCLLLHFPLFEIANDRILARSRWVDDLLLREDVVLALEHLNFFRVARLGLSSTGRSPLSWHSYLLQTSTRLLSASCYFSRIHHLDHSLVHEYDPTRLLMMLDHRRHRTRTLTRNKLSTLRLSRLSFSILTRSSDLSPASRSAALLLLGALLQDPALRSPGLPQNSPDLVHLLLLVDIAEDHWPVELLGQAGL